jgi:heme exporter protein B
MSIIVLIVRDLRLATRLGGNAFVALAFFGLMATLIPLGVGAQVRLLTAVAAGVLWVAAVLAALLALDRLFQADFEDGSLDLLTLGPLSLESVAAAKLAAHWLTTGLPLTILAPVAALLFNLPGRSFGTLMAALAIGTPAVSAIGSIGAGLTLSVRRGGLVLPLIVMPLLAPVIIFGAGAIRSTQDGVANGALLFLGAFSFAAVLLSPFAAAAGLRLNLRA